MLGQRALEELQSVASSALGVHARFFWLSSALSHHRPALNEVRMMHPLIWETLRNLMPSRLTLSAWFISSFQDFIFNRAGLSVAFVLMTEWNEDTVAATLERVGKIRKVFRNCYVIFAISSNEGNQCFLDAYFRSKSVEIAMPPFILVVDGPMALERMLNLADVHAECKLQGTVKQVDQEREELVCSQEAFVAAISSIRGLSPHDANTLQQGIGSIEEIMGASREEIMDSTDLSAEKAEAIVKFFHDAEYYMTPVPNQ